MYPLAGISPVRLVNWPVLMTDFDKIETQCRNYLIPDLCKRDWLLLQVKVSLGPVLIRSR